MNIMRPENPYSFSQSGALPGGEGEGVWEYHKSLGYIWVSRLDGKSYGWSKDQQRFVELEDEFERWVRKTREEHGKS